MIPEGPVVRVLLHRHQLHHVVSRPGDPRQDLLGKFTVAVHPRLLTAHADMRFVNQRCPDHGRIEVMTPRVRNPGPPDLPAEVERVRVLHRPAHAGRHAVAARTIGADDMQLDALTMRKRIAGQAKLPHPSTNRLQRMRRAIPAVEVADQRNPARGRRPLAQPPDTGLLGKAGPGLMIGRGMIHQSLDRPAHPGKGLGPSLDPPPDGPGVWRQPRVVDHQLRQLRRHIGILHPQPPPAKRI